MPDVSACSSCGRAIIWAFSPNGARLPLDARPVVMYYLDESKPPNAIPVTAEVLRGPSDLFAQAGVGVEAEVVQPKVYVSHFVTCPNAAQHSKGKK